MSDEFASYRAHLRSKLTRPNVDVKVQEDFIASGSLTIDKLDDYVRHCDAVVHLAGDMTGSVLKPPALASIPQRHPDLAQRMPALADALLAGRPISYTQWEAYLALYHGKTLLIAAPMPQAARDERFAADDEQRASQQEHLARLRQLGQHVEIRFGHVHELAVEVLRSPIFDLLHARSAVPTLLSAARTRQDTLVQRHELFGGRDDELARLDQRLAGTATSFHFVYGPSGYGKTALLANWVRRLQARHQPVVYQFISRLEGMAGEEFALRNLSEQLVAVHGLPGALPASVDELRNVYLRLLERPTPGDQPLTIVVDGLDEANGWEPRGLFPATAGPRLHMVFSARVDNDEDRDRWLSRLGVPRRSADWLRLGPMDAAAIAGLLRRAGGRAAVLASNEAFVQALAERSGGDPFYLCFLVKDVESGDVDPGNLARQPAELADYLQQWLDQLHEDVDIRVAEVYALVGLLSVALGPLQPADLAGASPLLSKGALLDRELSGSLRRYLAGTRRTGVALCHPRFRDFLCQRVFTKDELATWRAQLLDHCRRWRTADTSVYVLDHLVAHLIEDGATGELFDLIGPEWKAARMRRTGSARAFAQDLELALHAATAARPPALLQAIRCSLLHASVVSAAQAIAPEVLALMARLGPTDANDGDDAGFGAAAALDHAALIREP
ncbi:MAG: ATP-binding protein, partial [Ramlibacter sp.]